MTALLFILAIVVGAFVVALVLSVSAERQEARRARRHLENLKRVGGRRDHGGWS